jgi:uncharacterized protein YdaU (DUF1376 family)
MAPKRETDIWMPLGIGAYLGKTMHLTTLHHGAYLLLLMDYWKRGPLPDDESQLASICKMDASSSAWSSAWAVLKPFFSLGEDGRWHNDRADLEIAKADANRYAATVKAKNAANARYHKHCSKDATSIRQASLKQTPSPSPTDITTTPPISPQKFELPIWIPERAWMDYEQMRAKKKHPLTDRARKMAVGKLEKLMNQGQNVEAMLYQSVFRAWDDFYAVHEDGNGSNQPQRIERISAATARNQRNDEILANVYRERHGDPELAPTGGPAEPGGISRGGHDSVLAKEPIVISPRGH